MSQLSADVNPIVVDKEAGASKGDATVKYEKEEREELWERLGGNAWAQVNVHLRTGLGDEADRAGSFVVTLKPGRTYEAGVFEEGHGPLATDPIRRASLTVFCVWRKPEVRSLITDGNAAFGGTWYWRQVHTNVPTFVVSIGASRTKPVVDGDGIPHLVSPDGQPDPTTLSNDHKVEIKPLVPGQPYYFSVLVADEFGNWEAVQAEFTTLRRKITVEFPTLHIYNDGDPNSFGEGEFWFRVCAGQRFSPTVLQEFHLPTQDIDDWGETDRPYPVGFAHLGALQSVVPGKENVWVASNGVEHDGIFDSDEGAWSSDTFLPLPAGRFVENVPTSTFTMDCPTATTGDDFHYGVEVRWSVAYLP